MNQNLDLVIHMKYLDKLEIDLCNFSYGIGGLGTRGKQKIISVLYILFRDPYNLNHAIKKIKLQYFIKLFY